MMIGVGNAWASTESYTITFETGSGDGTSASTSTACSTIVSDGSSYLSGNLVTATKAYYGGSSGLKLGTGSASGTIKMTLAKSVKPTSIVVNAKRYNSSTAVTLKPNGTNGQSLTSSFANYTFTFDGKTEYSYIQLEATKYCWISSVTIYYEVADIAVTGVSVSPSSLTMYTGGSTETLTATISPSDATNKDVTWSSNYTDVATVSSGVVTAVASGMATITVTSYADNTKSASCSVKVVTVTGATNDADMGTVSVTGNTITATPKSGYRVKSGTDGYTVTSGTATVTNNGDNTFTVSASADCTVRVNFEAIPSHTLSKAVNDADYGSVTLSATSVLESGTATATATPSDGYRFVNWAISGTGATLSSTTTNPTTVTMGTADATVTATFEAIPSHTLASAVTPASSGSVSLSATSVREDATATATATPESGYRFVSWAVSGTGATLSSTTTNPTTVTMGTADATVTATFERIYTVQWSINGDVDGSLTASYAEDEDIDFPDDPDDIGEKKFMGWTTSSIDGTTDDEPTLVTSATMGTTAITYYAVFAKLEGSTAASWTETALASLTSSDVFIFANGSYAVINNKGTSSAPTPVSITVSEGKVTSSVTDNIKWNVTGNATDGYTFYPNGSTTTWLYCNTTASSGSNDNIRVGTGNRKVWKPNNSGYLVTNDNNTARYFSMYSTQDFRSYTGTGNGAFVPKFYKYIAATDTYSAYCTTVADVTGVSLNKSATTIVVGETETLTATVAPADAGNKNVSWSSSNTSVATVDSDGLVTAVAQGTATITVTTEEGDFTDDCVVTVKNAHGLAYAETSQTTKYGEDFTAPTLTNPNTLTVAYSSSDTDVATVNASTGAVSVVGVGETTITATFAGNTEYINGSASYTLTVNKGDAGLAFAEDEYGVVLGNDFDEPELTNPHSLTVTYSSSDTDVATVNSETGAVTVKTYGETTITASTTGSALYAAGNASYTLSVTKKINAISGVNDSYTLDLTEEEDELTLSASATHGTVAYEVVTASTTVSEGDYELEDGVLTVLSKGKVVILASVDADEEYEAVEKTITVTVIDAPVFTTAADQNNMSCDDTYTVAVETDGDVTLSSSNTNVASVDGLVVTANAVGTATITVTAAAGEVTKADSKTFTVTVAAPAAKTTAKMDVIFEETFDKNTGNKGGNDDDFANGSATYNSANNDNAGWTVDNGYAALQCLRLGTSSKLGKAITPALGKTGNLILTFKAAAWNGGSEATTLKVSTNDGTLSASSVTLSKTKWTTFELTITNATTSTKVTFEGNATSNSRFFLDEVKVYGAGTESVKLNTSGYATFCSEYPLDFTDAEDNDYSAWDLTGIDDDNTLTFTKITGAIKGGQGILLRGEGDNEGTNATLTLTSADSDEELESTKFVGTMVPTYVSADTYYGLKGTNFVKVNASVVPAGKALISAEDVSEGGSAKPFTFIFDDTATGIQTVKTVTAEEFEAIFDLTGRRLSRPQKGINIVNGKKVLVK